MDQLPCKCRSKVLRKALSLRFPNVLGLVGDTASANTVLTSSFVPAIPLDDYTLCIMSMLSIPDTIAAAGSISTNISREDFQCH
eukprot:13916392-Ditylum_brightwellii.AAC.1